MQPALIEKILDAKFKLEEILGYQALDRTLDEDIELRYIKDAVAVLDEIYEFKLKEVLTAYENPPKSKEIG